jgi:hypothetical protein
MKSFAGPQFAQELNAGRDLSQHDNPLVFMGMAKKSESPDIIEFAIDANCESWLPIPVVMIERVDHLGRVSCNGHHHDRVLMHMIKPTTEEGAVLSGLLGQIVSLNKRCMSQEYFAHGSLSDSPASISFGLSSPVSFGWPVPHIPVPKWPPIRIPDPRVALRNQAEQLARATAERIDREKGNSSFCPREEIRSAITALGLMFTLTPDPTGSGAIMASVMFALALTLPDEYCKGSGR